MTCFALVSSASAFATAPEFKAATKQKVSGSFAAFHLTLPFNQRPVACTKGTFGGEVTGAHTLGNIAVTFTGCATVPYEKKETVCGESTAGAREGEIVLKALTGELGTVAKTEAVSGVGLLLKPVTKGGQWAEFDGSACTVETGMSGSLALEVATVGKSSSTNKLVATKEATHEKIKTITLASGEQVKPQLAAFTETQIMEGIDELTFEKAVEVT